MKLTPITFNDYTRLQPYFGNQRYRLCSYSLPSIIAWENECFRPVAAVSADALFVGGDFTDAPDKCHMLLPISPSDDFSPDQLCAVADAAGYGAFWFVPACYIDTWGREEILERFDVEEQTAYEDYVYRASDLQDLPGNRYAKKRNLINQFRSRYVDTGRVRVESITSGNTADCAEFLEIWCDLMQCGHDPEEDLACEKLAILNTLEYIDDIDIRGLLIRIDGQVSAFGMGSELTDDMGVLQFEKAYADIKGLYQYLDNRCARELFNGHQYINKESDMDVPGLARAKRSYHPVDMVKSYKLIMK